IASIAGTKLRSMQKSAILGRQVHSEVEEIYRAIAAEKGCDARRIDDLLNRQEQAEIHAIALEEGLVDYLQENLLLALSGLKYLGFEADVAPLAQTPFFGRLTKFKENILLDVGHNTLAAAAIAATLLGKKYTLIYNSYQDKDYAAIIKTLKPIISDIELIAVDNVRIEQQSKLEEGIRAEGIPLSKFTTIKKNKNYLVFGSFSVVEAFLKGHYE
ncbi:MAG: bifunctional folylpolyglutamate synthase/dihydrofolate synthase, partial [Thiovulaceae bacterium]|nr:bifunctional folylpolyglutamate synthase/dihydrofolate synthase [Sulfurimonadaceae bacterium]